MRNSYFFIIFSLLLLTLGGCIEDGLTTSPSDRPTFSVDTLDMGVIYTDELSATHRFVVYNRHNKGLNLSDIRITGENSEYFRFNVDGMAGTSFKDIEIRANDSIYVFVSAELPGNDKNVPHELNANIDFNVNGQISTVTISAKGQDITRLNAITIDHDLTLTEGKPYRVTDSLVVAKGATLTLEAGTRLLFHDNSTLIVYGTLIAKGLPQQPVIITGDRTGNVITDVSFDLMSRQWSGVVFASDSQNNWLEFTEISNTWNGVIVYGDGVEIDQPKLTLLNCRLRNSHDCTLAAIGASVDAHGCEFAEAGNSLIYLLGGKHRFDQCTVSNHYLFAAIKGAAWTFDDPGMYEETSHMHPTTALVTNTITYGLGKDVEPGDLSGYDIWFKRCLFKSQGTDDDNFIDTLWDTDPLFYTVRSDYIFDYRLKPESPAIGSAYLDLGDHRTTVDYYGEPRSNDLGAYVFVMPADQ